MQKNITCIVALLLSFWAGRAQSVQSVENIGLDNVSIIEIIGANSDAWIGSIGQGVAFYDGAAHTWAYFSSANTPQFVSDTVTSITAGVIGGVRHAFIGTTHGVVVNINGAWDTLSSLITPAITAISPLNTDSLYVFTVNGAAVYDTSGLLKIGDVNTGNSSIPSNHVTCTMKGSSTCPVGYFTAGTPDKGAFFTTDGSTYTIIDTSIVHQKLVDNHVNAIYMDNTCMARLIGTQGGFSVCPVNGQPCQNFTTANGLPQNDITSVAQDCKGNIVLGTRDSGVVEFVPPSTFNRITTSNGLTNNRVTAVAANGSTCTTWVGTSDGSIAVIDSNKTVVGVLSGINQIKDGAPALVYPQPAGNAVNIIFPGQLQNVEFSLYNFNGSLVHQQTQGNVSLISADISALPNGIYFYRIISGGQIYKTGKIQVLR